MDTLSTVLIAVGLFLIVLGIRFQIVSNSIHDGRPSNTRRKKILFEFFVCTFGGLLFVVISVIGIFISNGLNPYSISVANSGVAVMALGIPQYLQYHYSKDKNVNKLSQISTYAWVIIVLGIVVLIGSVPPFLISMSA